MSKEHQSSSRPVANASAADPNEILEIFFGHLSTGYQRHQRFMASLHASSKDNSVGQDREIASRLSQELKKKFQRVFDYRDGESITPGEPWITQIFDKLSGSKLGISLVSPSYLASGNCTHEAQEMIALRDEDKMAVIPLKLYKEDIERPTWMRNRQYMHYYDYQDIKTLVDMIVKFYDTGKIANKHIHAIASDDNDEMPRD